MTDETISVRDKALERVMGSVERYLLGTPKTRSEKPRNRAARLFDIADEVRAILEAAEVRPETAAPAATGKPVTNG